MGFVDDQRLKATRNNKSRDDIGATVLSLKNIPWTAHNIMEVKEADASYFMI